MTTRIRLDALVDDLVAIAQTPAPTFAEEARLAWLERRLSAAPGRRERDAVGNLVWRWGDGTPRVLLTAHVDTVFGPDTDLTVRREDGALVGPGVGDNAAAVAAVVHVVSSLLAGTDLAAGAVAFTVGEEGPGNLRGAAHVCDVLEPRAVVALEGHWLDRVVVDAVGSARARVLARGPGGHSWNDRGRPSAVHALVAMAARVMALNDGGTPVNVGRIAGGRAINAIADAAEMQVEMRATRDAPLDGFVATLEELAGSIRTDGLDVGIETIGRRSAGTLDRGSDLLAAVRAVRAELGLADRLAAGSTDAAAALERSIPALCLGITTGSGMHTAAERIDVAPLEAGCRQLERVIVRLLTSSSASLS